MYTIKATKVPDSKLTYKMVNGDIPVIKKFKSLKNAKNYIHENLEKFRIMTIQNKYGRFLAYKCNYNSRLVK